MVSRIRIKTRGDRKHRPHLQCNLEAATLHFDHLHAHDTRISIFSCQHQQHQDQEKNRLLPTSLYWYQGHSVGAITAVGEHLTRHLHRYRQRRSRINARYALLCLLRLPRPTLCLCCASGMRHVLGLREMGTIFKPVMTSYAPNMPPWQMEQKHPTKAARPVRPKRGSRDPHSSKRWTPSEICRRRICSQGRRWWRACF